MNALTFYKPLQISRREIRLLELEPGQRDEAIICRLTTVSLLDIPRYEALSYVWGNAKKTAPIQVCNERFTATRNLEAALRDLRSQDSSRTLWVDAVCINQMDIQERTEQVKLMGQIYQQAISVEAYISNVHILFVDFIQRMAGNPALHWEAELKKLGEATQSPTPMLRHICKFFQHSWWNRVWTFQEAVLAKELRFSCSGTSVSSLTLMKFADNFCHHYQLERCCQERENEQYLAIPMMWSRSKNLKNLYKLSKMFRDGHRFGFANVIVSERHRDATNPRDHVIGMLGLLPGAEQLIDYDASIAEIFERSVLHEIQQTRTLDILSQVIVPDIAPLLPAQAPFQGMLPSWVPNWAQHYSQYSLNDIAYRQNLLHLYDASKGAPAKIISHDHGRLGLQGIICGSIVELGRTVFRSVHPSRPTDLTDDIYIVLPAVQAPETASYPYFANGSQGYTDALMRIVCGDIVPMTTTGSDNSITITEWRRTGLATQSTPFAELSNATTSNRRLCRTASGYVGLVPKTAQINDIICILLGGRVPFVIREEESKSAQDDVQTKRYRLIGDTYMHGLMDGEALDLVAAGTLRQQSIVLGGMTQQGRPPKKDEDEDEDKDMRWKNVRRPTEYQIELLRELKRRTMDAPIFRYVRWAFDPQNSGRFSD